eukprot:GFUD01025346.1.p1 GENE.GFUD01025346.1~~GFUD01025346.1.p1  ORF type:complete len:203 (+),score=48.74 GFUD01025346.1:158-766(+)
MGGNSKGRGFFDLKKQFIFYASYHNNPVNVAIHLFCIWNLVWSGLALQHHAPVFMDAPAALAKVPLLGNLPINIAMITTLIYVVTYVLMDPIAGSLGALLMLYLNQWTGQLVSAGEPVMGLPLWQAVLGFHALMWIVQFIGHGVFEGRAPALLESWDQALITAPLFVILEVLFFFGYRKSFYTECMAEVKKEIDAYTSSKSK